MANNVVINTLSVEERRTRVSVLLRQVDAEMKNGNLDRALQLTHEVYQYDTKNLYARALEERIQAMKADPERAKAQKESATAAPQLVVPPSPQPSVEINRPREEAKPSEPFVKPQPEVTMPEFALPRQREASLVLAGDTAQIEAVEQHVMQKMNSILESKQRELEEEFQRRILEIKASASQTQDARYAQQTSLQQLQINTMPVVLNYQEQQDKELRDRLFLERQIAQEEMFRRLEEAHRQREEELQRHLNEQHEHQLESEITKARALALKTYRSTLTMLMQYKVPKVVQQAITATMRATLMLTEEEHLEVERAARADAYTQEVRDILGQQPQTTSYDEALSKLKSLYSISEDEHKILVRKVKRDLGMPDETAVILVVDDEPAMLSATALLLEETYTSVLTADSVEKAGAVLHQQTPDVILSDVGLPGTGGFTFFENIQQGVYGEAVKSVPFVFVSGMGDQYFIKSAKQLGAKAYLVKPYTKEELEKTVMEALA